MNVSREMESSANAVSDDSTGLLQQEPLVVNGQTDFSQQLILNSSSSSCTSQHQEKQNGPSTSPTPSTRVVPGELQNLLKIESECARSAMVNSTSVSMEENWHSNEASTNRLTTESDAPSSSGPAANRSAPGVDEPASNNIRAVTVTGYHQQAEDDENHSEDADKTNEDLTNNNNHQRGEVLALRSSSYQTVDQLQNQQQYGVKKEDHLFASSCLYSAGMKQEDLIHHHNNIYGSSSHVKLEPDQQHDVHLYNAALYEPRTCWASPTAPQSVYQPQSGYPEFDHYSALQKLSCSFPAPPSSSTSEAVGNRSGSSQCLQTASNTMTNQQSTGYRMMSPSAAAAAAAVAAMSTPLYAMSSLSYSEWNSSGTSATGAISTNSVGRGGSSSTVANSSGSTSTSLTKGKLLSKHHVQVYKRSVMV